VIFSQGLHETLGRFSPTMDADAIIALGATAFGGFMPPTDIPGVLAGFSKAINWVFYLAIGLSGIPFLASFGVGWKSVKKQKNAETLDSEESGGGVGDQK
jgi:H+/gluconate symporter-like permease